MRWPGLTVDRRRCRRRSPGRWSRPTSHRSRRGVIVTTEPEGAPVSLAVSVTVPGRRRRASPSRGARACVTPLATATVVEAVLPRWVLSPAYVAVNVYVPIWDSSSVGIVYTPPEPTVTGPRSAVEPSGPRLGDVDRRAGGRRGVLKRQDALKLHRLPGGHAHRSRPQAQQRGGERRTVHDEELGRPGVGLGDDEQLAAVGREGERPHRAGGACQRDPVDGRGAGGVEDVHAGRASRQGQPGSHE